MAYNPGGGGQPPFNPQYQYNAAPPPPPKSGMSTGAKVALFGCLGVLVLTIVVVVVIAVVYVAFGNKNGNILGNSNDSRPSTSNSNSSSRNSSTSNSSSTPSTPKSGVYVDSLELAEDDSGKAGTRVSAFKASDNPIHIVIHLSEFESGTKIKVVLVAVNVSTGDKNRKVGEIEKETTSLQNQLDVTFTFPADWPTGSWRADVYVNGTLDKGQEFQITS